VRTPFLHEAKIDFERSMIKSAFKIHNPNAASGCGCGKSFSVG
jgi:iron-sulfur cluster assembly protein